MNRHGINGSGYIAISLVPESSHCSFWVPFPESISLITRHTYTKIFEHLFATSLNCDDMYAVDFFINMKKKIIEIDCLQYSHR